MPTAGRTTLRAPVKQPSIYKQTGMPTHQAGGKWVKPWVYPDQGAARGEAIRATMTGTRPGGAGGYGGGTSTYNNPYLDKLSGYQVTPKIGAAADPFKYTGVTDVDVSGMRGQYGIDPTKFSGQYSVDPSKFEGTYSDPNFRAMMTQLGANLADPTSGIDPEYYSMMRGREFDQLAAAEAGQRQKLMGAYGSGPRNREALEAALAASAFQSPTERNRLSRELMLREKQDVREQNQRDIENVMRGSAMGGQFYEAGRGRGLAGQELGMRAYEAEKGRGIAGQELGMRAFEAEKGREGEIARLLANLSESAAGRGLTATAQANADALARGQMDLSAQDRSYQNLLSALRGYREEAQVPFQMAGSAVDTASRIKNLLGVA